MSVGFFLWHPMFYNTVWINWWRRRFSSKGLHFWASFSEGLQAPGGQLSFHCPWELTSADDLKAVTIQSCLTLIWGWEWELFLPPRVLHYPLGDWPHTDNPCSSTPAHTSQLARRWAQPLTLLHASMREIRYKDMLGSGESNASVSTVGHGIVSAFRAWHCHVLRGRSLLGVFCFVEILQ